MATRTIPHAHRLKQLFGSKPRDRGGKTPTSSNGLALSEILTYARQRGIQVNNDVDLTNPSRDLTTSGSIAGIFEILRLKLGVFIRSSGVVSRGVRCWRYQCCGPATYKTSFIASSLANRVYRKFLLILAFVLIYTGLGNASLQG